MRNADIVTAVAQGPHRVVSTDLFDTVLLRDHSTEAARLGETSRRAARELDVDPGVLARLRWSIQDLAYRAVTAERPEGEASLAGMCSVIARLIGVGPDGADVLHRAEVAVDIGHLRPNTRFLHALECAAQNGKTVIAVSDTYYSTDDLDRMLAVVLGRHPIVRIYASADMGFTKHDGLLYPEVACREDTPGERILHVGDNDLVDVGRARAAGWQAVHLPRGPLHAVQRIAGRVPALPDMWRRAR